jgi:hypothetical protein
MLPSFVAAPVHVLLLNGVKYTCSPNMVLTLLSITIPLMPDALLTDSAAVALVGIVYGELGGRVIV